MLDLATHDRKFVPGNAIAVGDVIIHGDERFTVEHVGEARNPERVLIVHDFGAMTVDRDEQVESQ